MAARITYTAVRSTRGRRTHGFTLVKPLETACGKDIEARGWYVCSSIDELDCPGCEDVIGRRGARR